MVDDVANKRIVLYIPEKDYLSLRARLILLHKSASQWFREQVKAFLRKPLNQKETLG